MGVRLISYSEVSKALDCSAAWDFAYGGHLAGSALKLKRIAPHLQGGSAWGAAVASLHAFGSWQRAVEALDASLERDADRQRALGVHRQEDHDELRKHLLAMLEHYVDTAPIFEVSPVAERELVVPIPGRTGGRSSKYRLQAFIDAFEEDFQADGVWLVEYKLRNNLMPAKLIQRSRQIRWYSWAWWQETGRRPLGVKVVERLNESPKPPRTVAAKKKAEKDAGVRYPSHAKDQLCTPEDYVALCERHDEEPSAEALEAMRARKWQQVVPVMFRPSELEEAGEELVAAAKMIGQLDSGAMMPLRNAKRQTCGGCFFDEICTDPDDALVDDLYERKPPKRDRTEEQQK